MIKVVFDIGLKCHFLLLFSLFLLLFMSHIVLFGNIYKSHCTISATF